MPSENSAVTTTLPTTTGDAVVSPNGRGSGSEDGEAKSPMPSTTSFDPTEYVQKQRVTKTTPPKPAYNPLQFIQIKPCNLYQSAQDQLRKAEEVKKAKVTKKEDAEEWQGNLDSWKSSRRKRVEHIIERVVEVKKLEIEEHDRTRKKSKTFSEMMEERGGRRKISVPVYVEDESNDLSDLGIGTSSASGKSSMSEDFDNQSVISDNPDTEKSSDIDHQENSNGHRNISSPGYETCSSTAPTTSPDPHDYHQYGPSSNGQQLKKQSPPSESAKASKESTPEFRNGGEVGRFVAKRPSVTKIEDRLVNFELKSSTSESQESAGISQAKKDLPKVDITKRREMFEKEKTPDRGNRSSGDFTQAAPLMSIRERMSNLEKQKEETSNSNSAGTVASNRLSGDLTSIKDRLKNLEKENGSGVQSSAHSGPKFDVPLGGSIKDRLSSLHSATAATAGVPAAADAVPVSAKAAVVVGMAKKPQPVVEIDQVIEVETLKIEIEQIQLIPTTPMATAEPDSLMMMDSIQDVAQDYVTVKEEFREITDEDLFGGTDIELDDHLQQQDMSVLEALDIAFDAIDKDPGHGIATAAASTSSTATTTSDAPNPAASINHDDQLLIEECSNSSPTLLDNDKDIEQFIDDLIKQTQEEENQDEEEALAATAVVEPAAEETDEPHIEPVIEEKRAVFEMNAEPIYEIIEDVSQPKPLKSALKSPSKGKETTTISSKKKKSSSKSVSRNSGANVEPYYEVPNRKPVPLYENVDIFLASVNDTNQGQMLSTIPAGVNLEPPKIKPPPPPVESEEEEEGDEDDEEEEEDTEGDDAQEPETPEENLKRMNSTKRIKKDIRNKRSSFLGIEGSQDDDLELKLSIAPPPDMSTLIEEERRLEKQFLKTYDGIVERSDSGVSDSHSRQSSEPFTGSSEEQDDRSKELEDVTQQREWSDDARMQNIEEQIREQEEVLRVERELLQIEQEELKRQRANLLLRENYARKELDNGSKMLMSANRLSLQNLALNGHNQQLPSHLSSSTSSTTSSTFNVPAQITYSMQPQSSVPMEYRQSMPNLQSLQPQQPFVHSTGHATITPLTPPAKPSRQLGYVANGTYQNEFGNDFGQHMKTTDLCEEFVQLRDHQGHSNQPGNMSRHTLHALSAVPKPKLTDVWVQQQATTVANNNNNKYFPIQRKAPITAAQERVSVGGVVVAGEQWIARKPDAPKGLGYGKHWLVQEAEQRRLDDQQRGVRPVPNPQNWPIKSAGHLNHRKSMPDITGEKKPLPDAVINTITQRLQSRMSVGNVVDKRRFDANPAIINSNASLDDGVGGGEMRHRNHEQVLSVSGKKKCSHCDLELGRGAAMIVESLRLFYHIDCFKCCVCLVRLGDGMNGTDVRVRNHKLHCQNCYSSDDGIKFSCV